jgi:hypothetical protein
LTTLLDVVAKTDLVTITAWNESLRVRWADKLAAVPLPEHTVSGFIGTVQRPSSAQSPLAQYALEIIEAALASQPRLQQ